MQQRVSVFFFSVSTHRQSDFFSLQFDESLQSQQPVNFGFMKLQIALKKNEALKPSVHFLGLRVPLNYFIDWNETASLTVCVRDFVVIFVVVVIGN